MAHAEQHQVKIRQIIANLFEKQNAEKSAKLDAEVATFQAKGEKQNAEEYAKLNAEVAALQAKGEKQNAKNLKK